jgi:hypothetical protein
MGISFQLSEQDFKYPDWQKIFLEAALELDQGEMKNRVAAAETILSDRLKAVSQMANCEAERQALNDALQTLRILKTQNRGCADH